MTRGRAGRGHLGEDVRLAESSEPLLSLGIRVRSDRAPEHSLRQQDECRAESLRVELIGEGEVGQVSAVSDEERLIRVDEYSLHGGSTVLNPERKSPKGKTSALVSVAERRENRQPSGRYIEREQNHVNCRNSGTPNIFCSCHSHAQAGKIGPLRTLQSTGRKW